MQTIGVTGPRRLELDQLTQAMRELETLCSAETVLHVGDANGLDNLARTAGRNCRQMKLYKAARDGRGKALPWELATRSERMVRGLAQSGGTLHAWPNKPAPAGLQPNKRWPKGAEGSGTWGTIALAVGLGVPVVMHPLADVEMPDWTQQRQLTLM